MVRDALGVGGSTLADATQPREVADYLATQPDAPRLFNHLDWGGYLGWRLAPDQRIFVDDRHGLYTPEVFRDYARIVDVRPGWEDVLAHYGVDAIVLSRQRQRDLTAALAQSGAWRRSYCDPQAVVYVRRGLRDEPAAPTINCPAIAP